MADKFNTPMDLKKFFSTPEKPCASPEIMEFWKSLSEEEKDYYRTAPLV